MFHENIITRLRANQIANITCDFKVYVNEQMNKIFVEMAAQIKVVHGNFSAMRTKTFFMVHS